MLNLGGIITLIKFVQNIVQLKQALTNKSYFKCSVRSVRSILTSGLGHKMVLTYLAFYLFLSIHFIHASMSR